MKLGLRFFVRICFFGMYYQIAIAEQDVYGRTPLMNYIIAQENTIKKNRQEIERLWNICYKTMSSYQSHYQMPTVQEQLKKQLESSSASSYTLPQILHAQQAGFKASSNSMGIGKKIITSSSKTVRKESCTDEDMQAYEQSKQNLTDLIAITIQQLELMVASENNLAVVDNLGKTVLNYCDTFIFYKKLRELGAPFQFDTWFYWYV